MVEQFANNAQTTLDGAVDNAVTTITVASDAGFPDAPFRVRIDDEFLRVTATAGTGDVDWTVERGIEGSVAASHLTGADVWHVLTAGALQDHYDATTGVHGVGASTVESVAGAQAKADAVLPAPTTDGEVLTLVTGAPAWAEPSGGVATITVINAYHFPPIGNWTQGILSLDTVYWCAIPVDVSCGIDALSCNVGTGATGGVVRMGLYTMSDTTLTLVDGTDTTASAETSGAKVLEFTETPVNPPVVWVALVIQGNGNVQVQRRHGSLSGSFPLLFNLSINHTTSRPYNIKANESGALPTTLVLNTLGSATGPEVAFRRSS